MKKQGFSLIEVIFAIAFLVLVGVAMATLNNAAARLTETTELKQIALGLNEQSLAFVALEKRTKGANFATAYGPSPGIDCIGTDKTCYVVCPPNETNPTCGLIIQKTKSSLQVGTSKLQFVPSIVIREAYGTSGTNKRYLVNATTSWGKGVQRQMTTARILE
ncbi:MAG: hypothetical protein NUV80_07070 [Candidatus Berkelbacteria bacterium]|nr:hypothetical protein [Candidatus Berkelbacteria bacterium]MCR4308287.1 hypothetical protein [Candidatus Berkelbacteria bacterium]